MRKSKCVHHWIVEPPHGREWNRGTCEVCGKTRRFPAWLPEDWSVSYAIDPKTTRPRWRKKNLYAKKS